MSYSSKRRTRQEWIHIIKTVEKERQKTGESLTNVLKEMGIPKGTYTAQLHYIRRDGQVPTIGEIEQAPVRKDLRRLKLVTELFNEEIKRLEL